MKLVVLIAAVVLASNTAFAQDIDCPPRMPKPLTTTRVPQLSDSGVESIITVSEGDVDDIPLFISWRRECIPTDGL